MKMNSHLSKIVLYQHAGFLIVIVLSFLDELIKLPALIFSDQSFNFAFKRSTVGMLLILAVWLLVSNSTARLLKRVRHLEAFMRVCAWCRRIDCKGEWMPLEQFMRQSFDTPTTHGICPECLAKQRAAVAKAKMAGRNKLRGIGVRLGRMVFDQTPAYAAKNFWMFLMTSTKRSTSFCVL